MLRPLTALTHVHFVHVNQYHYVIMIKIYTCVEKGRHPSKGYNSIFATMRGNIKVVVHHCLIKAQSWYLIVVEEVNHEYHINFDLSLYFVEIPWPCCVTLKCFCARVY